MRPQPFRQDLLDPPAAWCRHQGCSRRDSRCSAESSTLTTYLPCAFRDLCGKPIPAPLKCHSAGRGTSVPSGHTDACGWPDCVSRREPATVGTWRQTTTRKGSAEATKQQKNCGGTG